MKRTYLWPLTVLGAAGVISMVLVGDPRMSGGSTIDEPSPTTVSSVVFELELNGEGIAGFDECLGLGSSNDVEENTVLTDSGVSVERKTPGVLRWQNITLKRRGPSGADVWSWRKAMEAGTLNEAVRDGAVVMSSP